jgi:predicted aspartyl protease
MEHRMAALGPTFARACLAMLLVGARVAGAQVPQDAGPGRGADLAFVDQLSTTDRAGRIVTDASLNGAGPLRFILDTGANRSAISVSVARTLDVGAAGNEYINVHGVTGPGRVPVARIDRMQVGTLALADLRLPVLQDAVFAGADGILGIDNLQHARVEIDFTAGRVVVRESSGRRARRGYLLVPAHLHAGGLLLVHGKVGRLPVKVILDTGAERSMGNLSLLHALQASAVLAQRTTDATVIGATPGDVAGTAMRTPLISIGEATLKDIVVTFGDLHVFEVWGLGDEPALVVGMDLLGTLEGFVIDYPRREFLLRPPADPRDRVRRRGCGDGCSSVMHSRS